MAASEIATVCAAVAAVLGTIGGTLRYLVRVASVMERTSHQATTMGEAFQRHVTASETFHAALTDRVSVHGEQLAALTVKVDGLAP